MIKFLAPCFMFFLFADIVFGQTDTISKPSKHIEIKGHTKVSPGTEVAFFVEAVPGATSYVWAVSSHMSISGGRSIGLPGVPERYDIKRYGGQGTTKVTIAFHMTFDGGTLNVTARNANGILATGSLNITRP